MAETLDDILVPNDQYVNLNTLSGIVVGKAMLIKNKAPIWIRLQESTTQPAASSKNGEVMTDMDRGYAGARIKSNSLAIWAITTVEGRSGRINIQEDV